MQLDLTISLGNIVSLVGSLGGVLAAYLKIRDRLKTIEVQMEPLWKAFLEGKIH